MLKKYFFHSHLDYYPDNLGNLSEELRERFHHAIKEVKWRHQERWNVNIMVYYYLTLMTHCKQVPKAGMKSKKSTLAKV